MGPGQFLLNLNNYSEGFPLVHIGVKHFLGWLVFLLSVSCLLPLTAAGVARAKRSWALAVFAVTSDLFSALGGRRKIIPPSSGVAENPRAPLQGMGWGPFDSVAYNITLVRVLASPGM